MAMGTVVFVIFQNRVVTQHPVFSLNFSSAGKGPLLTSKAKNISQRCTLLAGRGELCVYEGFYFLASRQSIDRKVFQTPQKKEFMNEGCLCR